MFWGCETAILGPDEPNNPEHVFDLLWEDFDKHYALFQIRGIDWNELYATYRPMVSSKTNDVQLREILSLLIERLDDSHTVLYGPENSWSHTSGFALGKRAIKDEFSLPVIKSKYIDELIKVEGESDLHYSKIRGRDIGYIFLRKEEGNDPEKAISNVVSALSIHKAIILDIRTNDGGSARYAKIIAGAFSDGEYPVGTSQTRNGPRHGDFDEKTYISTQRTGSTQFLKPVILLTDRATISAGEYLTLHLKSFAHVTHIGDTTAGDFGAVGTRSFLPNGWTYQYSVQMFLLPDGKSLDGVGIAPDVLSKNEKGDIDLFTDKVLERALKYLFDTYRIQ